VVARLVERNGVAGVTVVEAEVELDATPEKAWSVVSDPYNLPHWDRHIAAVEGVPARGLAPGIRYTSVMKFMAVRARIDCLVLEFVPPHRAVTRLSGLVEAVVTTTVTALGADRSVLFHHIDYRFRGGVLGAFAAQSVRMLGGAYLTLRHGILAQKRQIEGSR